MIWFPTAIMKPQKHKNHMFIDFFNNWISAPFFDSNDILSYTAMLVNAMSGKTMGDLAYLLSWRYDCNPVNYK